MLKLNPTVIEKMLEECLKNAAEIDNNSDNRDGTEENGNPEEKQEEPIIPHNHI